MRRDRIVLVFARLPSDERRAKPFAGGGRLVETLHEELLRRTLAVARASGVKTRLVTTGSLAVPDVEVVGQSGDTFAQRLEHAVAGAFSAGFGEVVVVGGDTPALEPAHLRSAFAQLASADPTAVIGPAHDGGYYLLGLNAFTPDAFRGVPLCTPAACEATIEALASAGFAVAELPRLDDLDGEVDLFRLACRGGALGRAARAVLASRSRNALPEAALASRSLKVIRARGPPVLPSTLS